MKISIVTPSYNQANYLEQTINSVVSQEYPNLEYMVVDGGSTDGSVAIIERYAKHLAWWVSEKDRGQSHGINKGLARATGDIVGWLNSDDYYEPNALHTVAHYFKENPTIDLIYFDVRNFGIRGVKVHSAANDIPPELILTKVCLHQPGVFWRKSAMDRVGLLNEELHYVMDFEYWIRFFLNGKIKHIPQVVANFRVHNEAKTSNDPVEMYLEKNIVIANLFHSLKNAEALNILSEAKLLPEKSKAHLTLSAKLDTETMQRVLGIHILNNAYLEYRTENYGRAIKLLNHLNKHGFNLGTETMMLRIKIAVRKLLKLRR